MTVETVIPFAGDCPHRLRALTCVLGRWPWPTTIARSSGGAWCKAAAVMPAVASSTADVVVVADADVFVGQEAVEDAVRVVQSGAGWAIPHRIVYRLSEQATATVLAGGAWEGQPLAERPYRGIQGGGVVVARRETLLDCPLDPRFVGWGGEDESWAMALHCLHGPAWRGDAPLVHLWHPSQPRMTRRRGSRESWKLRGRYFAARHDPAAMRTLIEEAKHAARQPAEPAVRAPAA